MKDNENLYDKLRELIGRTPGQFTIFEDTIDVDLQVEYFEFSRRVANEYDEEWAMEQIEVLEDPDYCCKGKKIILARLATIERVEAYRAIESYNKDADENLKDWARLALQEAKMHLESHLLDENQVFISTGLGGRNNKLRYYVVLIARNRESLTEFQLGIIKKEFGYVMKKYDVEIEEFNSSGYLATFMLLLPINHSVKKVFSEGINECNQFGDFLRENCIVTNVKKLTFKEVRDFIEQKNTKD